MGDPEKAMDVVDDNDHESLGEEEEEEDDKALTSKLLANPAVMAALQGKLQSMVGTNSGYIQSLPAPVKRRLKALKKLQFEATKIEAKFYEEIHELECKYHELYTPIYTQRAKISKGEYEPKDEECEWPSEDEDEDEDDEEDLAGDMKDKAKLSDEEKAKEKAAKEEAEKDIKGVPDFWLTIFKNVDMLQDMVQEHDEPALSALQDITVDFGKKPMGFKLSFHFGANEFFTNSVLTKSYQMKCEASEEDAFSFEGPEIFKCEGCPINWKSGKNLTIKTVKKKQKHKAKGNVRTVTKQVKNDSFFNFFDPPAVPDNEDEELDEDTQELLTSDFEVGHYIRERIIPRAVLYFTGEALEDDDFDDEEEEEEDCEEGEEEEDDPDFDPSKAKKGQNPQECKQQ